MFTIGHMAYRWEGVFFLIENALSAGKGGWESTVWVKYLIYDCLVSDLHIGWHQCAQKIIQ